MLKKFIRIAYIALCTAVFFAAIRYFEWPNDWRWFQIDDLLFIVLSLSSFSAIFIRGKVGHVVLIACSGILAAIGTWALTELVLQTTNLKDPYVASGLEIAVTSALVLIPLAMLMAEIATWRSRRVKRPQ